MSPAPPGPAESGAGPPATPGEPGLFRCDVSRQRDSASVRPVGELDLATGPVLAAQVARLRQAGCREVVIDLGGLAFMDSSGLHFFLECAAESRQDSFTLALLPGPPAVQQVFELTGTTAHLPFIDA